MSGCNKAQHWLYPLLSILTAPAKATHEPVEPQRAQGGIPVFTPKYPNPYYWDPQIGTPDSFWKLPIVQYDVVLEPKTGLPCQ